jgi:hypothetical protein
MPTHNYSTNPETLLMLAWCSTLNLRALVQKDRQARPHKYPGPMQDWLPVFPADVLKEQITKALACLQDALYGPVLQDLVSYRLLFVDMEDVAHTIGLRDLIRPSHGLFYSDNPFLDGQREKGPASETEVFLHAYSKDASLQERLLQLSQRWSGNVSQGALCLHAFFLAYTPVALLHHQAPFFVRELLKMSLERVNWHAIAAHVLGSDTIS